MATVLVDVPGRVVVLLGGAAPHALVVARSSDLSTRDAGQMAGAIASEFGGRAGGRADLAQGGGITATVEDVRALIDSLLG
jgi:alanyl-tRNA synthetase